jgi:hypothetical protein
MVCPLATAISSMALPIFPYPTSAIFMLILFCYKNLN